MTAITYDEFGRRFVEHVVTADRVEDTLREVVSGSFDTSVRMAAGFVKADGSGSVVRVRVDRLDAAALAYRAKLDVELDITVKISGMPYRYHGRGAVMLDLYAVAHDDLSIYIEIPDVGEDAVSLELEPQGRVAAVLDQLGGIEDQVRREMKRFVNARKEEPEAVAQRRVDVGPAIEKEWERRREGQ